jgi:hypothetical protein
MNRTTKIAVVAGLMLMAVASVVYATPVLAYLNGTADQTHTRNRDGLRDQTCSCDCLQTHTRTQLRLQEYTQNQTCPANGQQQNEYQYQFTHQTMLSP